MFSTVSTISTVNAKTYNLPDQTYKVEENGVEYTISVYQDTNGTKITIHTADSKDFVVEEISNNEETLKVTEYKYENNSFNASKKIFEESEVYD
jgi:hypothetical protein